MRFFMQTCDGARSLDCNDPDRNFAVAVPQLALAKAPCLLYVILAIAALQLSAGMLRSPWRLLVEFAPFHEQTPRPEPGQFFFPLDYA